LMQINAVRRAPGYLPAFLAGAPACRWAADARTLRETKTQDRIP